jgi:hypothetical protein
MGMPGKKRVGGKKSSEDLKTQNVSPIKPFKGYGK